MNKEKFQRLFSFLGTRKLDASTLLPEISSVLSKAACGGDQNLHAGRGGSNSTWRIVGSHFVTTFRLVNNLFISLFLMDIQCSCTSLLPLKIKLHSWVSKGRARQTVAQFKTNSFLFVTAITKMPQQLSSSSNAHCYFRTKNLQSSEFGDPLKLLTEYFLGHLK